MALDYTNPQAVVNFRDVGEFVNWLADKPLLPERRILRGGTLAHVRSLAVVGNPRTIFNLRKGPDPPFDVGTLHYPISNDYEKYQTSLPEVRKWLTGIMRELEGDLDYPLYFHCTSGKDRTGVVIAALLTILGIPRDLIAKEYLLSEGEVSKEAILSALDGIGDPEAYFAELDLDLIRRKVLGPPAVR
jgi:protein-tyrosine phosphatase